MSQVGRDLGDDGNLFRPRAPVGDRWALIVGISEYADSKLTLQYAHADAVELRDFLVTPAGGAFAPERISLLINEEATSRAVIRALRSFLGQTAQDDFVLISVACHGAPDQRGVAQPLYLLTYDTDLDDIAGTAVPMDEVAWCLKNYVRAKRIVMLADTCHSAGIASGARGGDLSAAALNRYLEQLSTTTPGVAFLTSARENQRSYEGPQWGDGHGVFTWFVLEGMRGAADGYGGRPKDGVVSLGELADYVTDRVFAETRRSQQPVLGGARYDLELPMAVAGGLDVEQHVATARALLRVGSLLDDPAAFRCAAREAALAVELAALTGAAMPLARCVAGEALLAAGDVADAARELEEAVRRFGDELPPEAWLHLGLARAALLRRDAAAAALSTFVERAPESRDAAWANDYRSWLSEPAGNVRALVIAIGRYELDVTPLPGPPNDAALLGEFLVSRLGLRGDDVRVMLDEEATRAGVINVLRSLAETSTERDSVVIYFGGHAAGEAGEHSPYLLLHDAPGGAAAGLTPAELVEHVAAIPARARILLLDTHGNAALNTLVARDGRITALVASPPGGYAFERQVGDKYHGDLTYALVQAWGAVEKGREVPVRELAAMIEDHLDPASARPVVAGDPCTSLSASAFPAANLWRAAQVRNPSAVPPGLLAACEQSKWPRGQRLRGVALAAAGRNDEALELLREAAAGEGTAGWVDVARVAVAAEGWDAAADALSQVEGSITARRAIESLRESRAKALLVGVSSHAHPWLRGSGAQGARNDVAAVRRLLLDRGFDEGEITVLEDAGATRDRILAEFRNIAHHARDQLGVFYLAGNGARTPEGEPTIVPYDGGGAGASDVTLAELAAEARSAANLVTILDAGAGYTFSPGARALGGSRGILVAPVAEPPVIGAVTVAAQIPGPRDTGGSTTREQAIDGEVRGLLTTALVAESPARTYEDWARATSEAVPFLGVTATGPAAKERALQHRTRRAAVDAALATLETIPAAQAIELVQRQAARLEERNEQSPPVYLELGLAYAAARKPQDAIRFLRTARNLYEDPTIRSREEGRDPHLAVWEREACYHLGRLLYQDTETAGELTEAVASLRRANGQSPNDPRIWFHLALAIRALVERQSLVEVADLLRAYLAAGAPLGRVEDVQAALAPPASAGGTGAG